MVAEWPTTVCTMSCGLELVEPICHQEPWVGVKANKVLSCHAVVSGQEGEKEVAPSWKFFIFITLLWFLSLYVCPFKESVS